MSIESKTAPHMIDGTDVGRRDMLRLGAGAAAFLALGAPRLVFAAVPKGFRVVQTSHGKLRGRVFKGHAEFKGIPYGASTGGVNRFRSPQPVRAWKGVRDALKLGDQCVQTNPDLPAWLDSSPMSEDCLRLNVWTPEKAGSSSGLPVMVWLHGGGYSFGSAGAELYDGSEMAHGGNVVVVGINHRLGIFGYTFFGDDAGDDFAGSGNAGNLDILAALKWVRDNIRAFGGDPNNVTIFGESGGGLKVTSIMGMAAAKGLFHKAIVQSGSMISLRERDEAVAWTDRVYATLGVKRGDVAALQHVPAAALLKCWEKVVAAHPTGISETLSFGPTVDGAVYAAQAWANHLAPEISRQVPMIIGVNLHEAIGFLPPDTTMSAAGDKSGRRCSVACSDSAPASFTDDASLAREAAKYGVIETVDASAVYPVIAAMRKTMPSLTPREQLVRVSTEIGFRRNAVRQAEWKSGSGGAPAFMYECHWRTPAWGGLWAPHGIEVPFVFNLRHYGTAWDGHDTDVLRDVADPKVERFGVGKKMFDAWMNFARTGDPSTAELNWPSYDARRRATMVFDRETRVVDDPRSELRSAASAI